LAYLRVVLVGHAIDPADIDGQVGPKRSELARLRDTIERIDYLSPEVARAALTDIDAKLEELSNGEAGTVPAGGSLARFLQGYQATSGSPP